LELGLETSLNLAEKLKHLKILGFHFLLNVVVLTGEKFTISQKL
jgi:hypothetical protein